MSTVTYDQHGKVATQKDARDNNYQIKKITETQHIYYCWLQNRLCRGVYRPDPDPWDGWERN